MFVLPLTWHKHKQTVLFYKTLLAVDGTAVITEAAPEKKFFRGVIHGFNLLNSISEASAQRDNNQIGLMVVALPVCQQTFSRKKRAYWSNSVNYIDNPRSFRSKLGCRSFRVIKVIFVRWTSYRMLGLRDVVDSHGASVLSESMKCRRVEHHRTLLIPRQKRWALLPFISIYLETKATARCSFSRAICWCHGMWV